MTQKIIKIIWTHPGDSSYGDGTRWVRDPSGQGGWWLKPGQHVAIIEDDKPVTGEAVGGAVIQPNPAPFVGPPVVRQCYVCIPPAESLMHFPEAYRRQLLAFGVQISAVVEEMAWGFVDGYELEFPWAWLTEEYPRK